MLKFELNIENRKDLAKRMEELTGIHPYYTRAPLYAYDIGAYTIDREGNLLVEPENADAEVLTTLLNEGLIRGGEDVPSDSVETIQNTAPQEPVVELAEGVQMIPAVQMAEDTAAAEQNAEGDPAAEEPQSEDFADTQSEDFAEPQEAESADCDESASDEESTEESAQDEPDSDEDGGEEHTEAQEPEVPLDMVFEFPISQHNGVTLRNLVNLIYSRGELISKATGGHFRVSEELVDALKADSCTFTVANFLHAVSDFESQHGSAIEGLKFETEKVCFTGFPTAADMDHLTAYGHLAILMNQQAISQKRIQAKEVNDANEKYALRTWLLRLGMNGPDFKQTRKILMENLSGHAAFRTNEEAEKFREREKAKRDALKAAKLAAQGGGSAGGEVSDAEQTAPAQPDCGADTAQETQPVLEAGA